MLVATRSEDFKESFDIYFVEKIKTPQLEIFNNGVVFSLLFKSFSRWRKITSIVSQ